jgi:ABC-type uncharacterized transport system fused permease/ATPase subunit
MTLDIFLLTFFIQTALSFTVSATSFYQYGRRDQYIKLIGLLFLLSFLANGGAYVMFHVGLRKFTNIPQSAYDFIGLVIVSLVFYTAMNKRFKKFFLTVTFLFLIVALSNSLFFQKEGINSYNKFLSSFIITCYCVFYFYRLMVELPSTHLQRMPMFWFTSAFLIYHAGTIFLFAFTSYLTDVLKNDLTTYWTFHNVLGIVEQCIVLTGLAYNLSALKKGTSSTG